MPDFKRYDVMYISKRSTLLGDFVKRSHAHRQSTSPQLNDVQNVAKSEDNFPNVIALEDSLSMFSVI